MTREEMKMLLSKGIGGPEQSVDRRNLERDFRFLLERAKDKDRNKVDIDYFDRKGPKNVLDFCTELADYECAARLDPETERLQRLARSAKTHVHAEGFSLQEEHRRYDNGDHVITEEIFALSETMMLVRSMDHIIPESREVFRTALIEDDVANNLLGNERYSEQPAEAAQRALLEEPQIYVAEKKRFDVHALSRYNRDINDPRILRESRVYIGMQSRVATYHVLLRLRQVPEERHMGLRYRDKKVWIFCSWYPIADSVDRDKSIAFSAASLASL